MARASASGDCSSTSRPAEGVVTISGVPQTAVATTGVPQASASRRTFGKSLPAGSEHQHVGGTVHGGQALLWHRAKKVHPFARSELLGQALQGGTFRPIAHDQQPGLRQARSRANGEIVALARDQPADREHDRPAGVQTQLAARRCRSCGANSSRSTPLRRTSMRLPGTPSSIRRARSASDTVMRPAALRRPAYQSPGQRILRYQVHVRATRRDHHWLAEAPPEQHRRHAVRVEVVRVDQVEAEAPLKDLRQSIPQSCIHKEGCARHAELGEQRVARMQHRDAVPQLFDWHPSESAIAPEHRLLERKPGHRRDHHRRRLAAAQQVPQPALHEDAEVGHLAVGVQR